MSFVEEEIASQPACWRRAAALATRLSAALPARGRRVALVGCGTSLFIAQSIMQISPNGRFSNWLQPHLDSGLYIDDWFTRVTFRLWPPRLH